MLNNANGASVWTQLVQITALTTILGRLPGPSAQRWEESPFPGRAAALGLPASPLEAIGGQVRRVGGGGLGGPLDPLLPTQGGHPRAGRSGRGGGGDRAP